MSYNIDFDFININCDVIPYNLAYILKRIIDQSPIGYGYFAYYGTLKFDETDNNHLHPVVTESDEYVKGETNCLVINLNENRAHYDKMYLYHSNGKDTGNYGFILRNSNNGYHVHKYFIPDELTDLFNCVNSLFLSLDRRINSFMDIPRFKEAIEAA